MTIKLNVSVLLVLLLLVASPSYAKGRRVEKRKATTPVVVPHVLRQHGASDSEPHVYNRMARKYVKQGNKSFQKRDFSEAETFYRKAIEQNKENPQALYNLGTALIAQGQDTTAIKSLEQAATLEKNPLRQSMAFHNLGTILQGRKMFAEAIEQYKQALRLNPNDDDARYNLVLCKHQMKNSSDGRNQNQDKDDKQNQENKNQQNEGQQKKDQQKQEQQKQDQQEQKPQMSKENAEQLLNAAMQQEKQTQKRMKEAQKQPQRRQVEKNW